MKNKDKIQVLGSGCQTCKKLFELTQRAVQELGIKTEVEYVTDIQKIIEMGLMQSPILAINGKPVMIGLVSDVEKIKELITKETTEPMPENKPTCGCGGNC